jgi:hypothetical protein
MSSSQFASPVRSLQDCLELADDITQHSEANRAFQELQGNLAVENPLAAELLGLIWKEMLAARRSALFWERSCDIEREMTEQMATSHLQLKQNYLRLMQEQ